ncbi:MAG TPA: phage recombination protein Bet, partial [Gemmatimonadaceae bacterium]|nr:phage recombination protein Bet [Gemmatimonadaceae bacterium]
MTAPAKEQATVATGELPPSQSAVPTVIEKPATGTAATQWTRERTDLLKRTVAKGATDDELALFIEVCKGTGLNPFVRQIHAIKRRTKDENGRWQESLVFQTGIDGYRLIAERTGKYEGQTEPEGYDADADRWVKVWTDDDLPPFAARVGVYKRGAREPIYGMARWNAYVQTTRDGAPTKFWKMMGPEQLAKCAEALALRKAFPQELAGVYTHEELTQADTATTISTSATAQKSPGLERDERGVILYPKAPYAGVALDAMTDPDANGPGGERTFIIPEKTLAGMLRALDGAITERQNKPGGEVPAEWAILHEAIITELERRRDLEGNGTGENDVPDAKDDAPQPDD